MSSSEQQRKKFISKKEEIKSSTQNSFQKAALGEPTSQYQEKMEINRAEAVKSGGPLSFIENDHRAMQPRHTSPLNVANLGNLEIVSMKLPKQKDSFNESNRRQVISKMMLTQSENVDMILKDSSPKKRLATSIQVNNEANLRHNGISGDVAKSGSHSRKLPMKRAISSSENDPEDDMMNIEHSQEESEENERNDRLPSRCNSEILSQKYEEEKAPQESRGEMSEEINPYDAIYDLSNQNRELFHDRKNSQKSKQSNKLPVASARFHSNLQGGSNKSAGTGPLASQASSRSRKRKPPLKMITLENIELSEINTPANGTRWHKQTSGHSENITPQSRQRKIVAHGQSISAYNVSRQVQNNQDLTVFKIQEVVTQSISNKQQDHTPKNMNFDSRTKTKQFRQIDGSQDSEYTNRESKTVTMQSGPDRSATSHLNIKLPPTMIDQKNLFNNQNQGNLEPATAQFGTSSAEGGSGIKIDGIRVVPMHLDSNEAVSGGTSKIQKMKPVINYRKKIPKLKQSAKSFKPSDIMTKTNTCSSKIQLSERSEVPMTKKIIEDDPTQVRRMLTTTQMKTSQKIPIPLLSQTSPRNSIRNESHKSKMADDEDASMTDADYKNFVMESPEQKKETQLLNGVDLALLVDENTSKEEPRLTSSPQQDPPPAAVQRVSFGMLPEGMQNMTPIQRASLLNEIELMQHFSVNEDQQNRMSQDSQEYARMYYRSKSAAAQESIPKKVYHATTKIKHKVGPQSQHKTAATAKVRMYAMPWNITVKAQSLIEKISASDALQIVFVKLWALQSKVEDIVDRYDAKKNGRTIFTEKAKVASFNQEDTTKQLTLRTAHHLLATVAIGILLVRSDTFHLHDSIFLLKILQPKEGKEAGAEIGNTAKASASKQEKEDPICSFDQFKLILLSLFGQRIFEMNVDMIDSTLRQVYKVITISSNPVFANTHNNQQKKHQRNAQNESSMQLRKTNNKKDQLSLQAADARESFNTSAMTPQSETAAVFGEVKEMNLRQLSDLIKMLYRQSQLNGQPENIQSSLCILEKFNLAVHKDIKYRNYRSAFSPLQNQLLNWRDVSFQQQALQKYQPENPWDRWKVHGMDNLPQKKAASKAENPLKINTQTQNESSNRVPKVAHKGRFQSFNFTKVVDERNQIQKNNKPQVQDQDNVKPDIAERGMIVKIDDLVKSSQTCKNDNGRKIQNFSSLNQRLQKAVETKKQAFILSLDKEKAGRDTLNYENEQVKSVQDQSVIFDPLQQNQNVKTLLQAFQSGQINPKAHLEQLVNSGVGYQGFGQMVTRPESNRPNSTYMTSRVSRIQSRNQEQSQQQQYMTLQQKPQKRPNTQQQGQRNKFNQFSTIQQEAVARVQRSNQLAATSSRFDHSRCFSADGGELNLPDNLQNMGRYKPMISGTLSSDCNTGTVRVDYDKSSMSIVVLKQGLDAPQQRNIVNYSQLSDSTRMTASFLQNDKNKKSHQNFAKSSHRKKPQFQGILYGGRGRTPAVLQNKIGIDHKTVGYQQFERQYLQYPIQLSHRESVMQQQNKGIKVATTNGAGMMSLGTSHMPQGRAAFLQGGHNRKTGPKVAPIPIALVKNHQQQYEQQMMMMRKASDLAIDGMQEPILSQETTQRSPKQRGQARQQDRPMAHLAKEQREQRKQAVEQINSNRAAENQQRQQQRNYIKIGQSNAPAIGNQYTKQAKQITTDDDDGGKSSYDAEHVIKRDSTLDMGGFTTYLQRTKTFESDMARSNKGTGLILKKSNENSRVNSSKPISLNIETVINVVKNIGGVDDDDEDDVDLDNEDFVPYEQVKPPPDVENYAVPVLQKTTTLFLK